MTDDLVAFLRAQFDDEERVARYAGGTGGWELGACIDAAEPGTTEWQVCEGRYPVAHVRGNTRAGHVARHDPARVLRDVEAKRAILNEHRPGRSFRDDGKPVCAQCRKSRTYPCTTVRLLALPYAEQPGYREEWKP